MQSDNGIKIYETAKSLIGVKLSGSIPEFGCAITVNNIVQRALGRPIGGGYSTHLMYQCLRDSVTRFKEVPLSEALYGDIIISPTGYGNGDLPNGHVGIMCKNDPNGILSNDSRTGELHQYFNLDKWIKFYAEHGGYPVLFYRAL